MTHYAIDAANRIVEKLEGEPSLVELVSAFATGCSALKRIQRDLMQGGLLRRDIENLAIIQKENSGAYTEALSNVDYFVNIFGQIEKEILQESGANKRLIEYLFHDIDKLLPLLRETELDANRISNYIGRLRGTVCDIWKALSAIVDSSSNHKRLRDLVVKALNGVAGAGIISANAAADIATLGPWVSPVSGAVGGALIGKSIS